MQLRAPILLALVHLGVACAHGAAHVGLGVFDPPLQTAFVLLLVHGAPMAALVLLARGRARAGLATLEIGLVGSLAYGTYAHFVAVSHDHVLHLPAGGWQPLFQITAGLITLVDAVGALAVLVWARRTLSSSGRHVVLIDGTCIFCNRLVSHILRRDEAGRFYFAHLQSEYAKAALARHGADPNDIDGVYVLVEEGTPNERLLVDGAAGRQIWPLLYRAATPLLLVPAVALNPYYRLFARYRYRLFGRYEACRVPSAEERARFLASAPA